MCRRLVDFAIVIPVYESEVDEMRQVRSVMLDMVKRVHPAVTRLELRFASTLTTVVTPKCVLSARDWNDLDLALRRLKSLTEITFTFHTFTAGGHYKSEEHAGKDGWNDWVRTKLENLRGECTVLRHAISTLMFVSGHNVKHTSLRRSGGSVLGRCALNIVWCQWPEYL